MVCVSKLMDFNDGINGIRYESAECSTNTKSSFKTFY